MGMYECVVDNELKKFYFDTMLHDELINVVSPKVKQKDSDYIFVVDGEEGSGKSVFTFQNAKILDRNFCQNNIAYSGNQFVNKVMTAKRFSAVVLDEAFNGLSSRAACSELNRLIVSLMMEMRQRNLFVFIVLPTVFLLDKYVVLHRARVLFHTKLTRSGQRGLFQIFSRKKMRYLYNNFKDEYEYDKVRASYYGWFKDFYAVNESIYRKEKLASFYNKQKTKTPLSDKHLEQRDKIIKAIYGEFGLSYSKIKDMFDKYGVEGLDKRTIGYIIKGRGGFQSKSIIVPSVDSRVDTYDADKNDFDANDGDMSSDVRDVPVA